MVFSSLFFTFIFLPVTVLLYYLLGKNLRNIVLLIASLFFYAWGEPVYILLMCGSIIINFCIGILLGRYDTSRLIRKLILILGLVVNLGCLAYFKYLGMIISTIESPVLPIGISFYTFQALSYVIDIYRRKNTPQKSFVLFALYITMFPQLVAGPIVNYNDIELQLTDRSMNIKEFCSGMRRFLCGLAKKILLANNIGLLWYEVKGMSVMEVSILMAWAGIVAFTLQIYFDFSGYSDMAIGLGKMFGFHLKENFRYPYTSQSISEFWRRWHISLGLWFKEYVYISLGGSRNGKWKLIRNMFIVWFLTGLWHGASWNFVIWGIYFGTIILIEKLFLQKRMINWPKSVRHIYSLFFVIIGWVIFEFTNLTEIFAFLRIMFGIGGNPFVNSQEIVKIRSYAFLFIICIIAALPWVNKMALIFKRNRRAIYTLAVNLYYCVLMFLLTGYMVSSTYNPFIYYRF